MQLDVLETKRDESRKMVLLLLIYCLIPPSIGNTSEIYSKVTFIRVLVRVFTELAIKDEGDGRGA